MTAPRVRLLPCVVADGGWNMAADDALLESASAGVASLRFYGWERPTLSLGYFQPADPARAHDGLEQLAWLRRPSGGAALVHHHELTYALALPAGPTWQPAGEPWPVRFHRVIQAALAELGVTTCLCATEQRFGDVLCFLHHTPGDVLLGACKIVGSAQRKGRGALLQHGGILLAQSPHTRLLPGIAELTGRTVAASELQTLLVVQLARVTAWAIEPADWTPDETAFIPTRLACRYHAAAWNQKR
ncbi:MAG: lipoate--protein ligase family protein [Gemmataceae bacterium]